MLWLPSVQLLGFAEAVLQVKHPRATAAVISAGVALVLLGLMASSPMLQQIDRRLFETLSGRWGEVVGSGTRDSPREIEVVGEAGEIPALEVLALDDEAGGYFEQMPPPPTDVMVVMDRLRDRGAGVVALGYPLQWEEADTLAVEAMRRVMDKSEAVVLGFPLKDSTAPAPVAAPFQRASVAYADVKGDGTKMPVVSNIRGLAPEMGGRKSLAGFTRLETEEPDDERAYLLARWSDRVVLALPVALEVARRGLAFEEVVIHMGREIRLGADGPRIPIDFRGRVDLPTEVPDRRGFPATHVIAESLEDGFAAGEGPLYLTDERLLGAKAERKWAEQLSRMDAAVRGAPRRLESWEVLRPHWAMEVLLILLAAAVLVSWLPEAGFKRQSLVLLGGFLGLSLMLVLMIRVNDIAPMPLALLSLPWVIAIVVGWSHFGGRVQVVDSEKLQASEVPTKPADRKRSRKRRRKGK